jgi:hypothetical protein
LEMLINALWLAPPIGAMVDEPSVDNLMALSANAFFDVGGILTPAATREGKIISQEVFDITQFLAFGYGLLSLIYGIKQVFSSKQAAPA